MPDIGSLLAVYDDQLRTAERTNLAPGAHAERDEPPGGGITLPPATGTMLSGGD
jgi:hypothetical protein